MAQGSGGGPGDHPGVTILPLSSDTNATAAALTAALAAGGEWLFNYSAGGVEFAVIVNGYQEQ